MTNKNIAEVDYSKLTVEETLKSFNTNKNTGLTEAQVKENLNKYGLNEIKEKEETTLQRILKKFWGPIPWMIETAAVLSALVQKWEDFGIITTLLLVNAGMEFWQENKAINVLKVLKNKLARKATVLRDGKFNVIDAKYLVPGDVVKLKIGEVIPADVKLIEGDYLQIDQSALTGESLPVTKHAGDVAYANSIVKQGEMLAVVIATAVHTYFGKTVALVAKAEKEEKSHFQKMVIKVGNYLIVTTLFMAVIIILNAIYHDENMLEILRFTLVLTVAAIPVALPAVLTVTMAVGAMNLAKKQAVVSKLAAIEELAGIDILCSDKTGTLTQNKMTIDKPILYNDFTEKKLIIYAALASQKENNDPIEKPIFTWIHEKGLDIKLKEFHKISFKPFDPVSKRTEAEIAHGIHKFKVTKGAPQVILKLCKSTVDEKRVTDDVNKFAEKGYRTLGVAVKEENENSFKYVGLIPLYDPPREDAKQTIREARNLGLDIKMVTGDNVAIANQIALKLGLEPKILEAGELKRKATGQFIKMSEYLAKIIHKKLNPNLPESEAKKFAIEITDELEKEFDLRGLKDTHLDKHESDIIKIIEDASGFAEVFPEDKYLIVDKLQKGNHIVGMTGDGVNDAPALKKADAGIAVSGATDAARAAADLVLLTPGISVIVDAIKMARVIFERMKSYSIFRIAETIRVILFMTLSIVVFDFYPLTALMIIILALLNDIPILTIAYDNTKIDEKPVRWNNRELFGLSSLLGVAGVISSFLIFFLLETYTNYSKEFIQAIIFAKMVVAGHGTIYNTRTTDWFFKKPYPSLLLFGATFSTRVIGTLMAVYGIFVPAVGWTWGGIVWAYALTWFVFNDIVKVYFYRHIIQGENLFKKLFSNYRKHYGHLQINN